MLQGNLQDRVSVTLFSFLSNLIFLLLMIHVIQVKAPQHFNLLRLQMVSINSLASKLISGHLEFHCK